MLRRLAADAVARLSASTASPSAPACSASASFTTSSIPRARVGARSTGRVIPGRTSRRVDPDAPLPAWAAAGWFEDALAAGGSVAAARALERRVAAFGAQATSVLPSLASAIKSPEDAGAALKALVALRAARAARGQTQPLPGKTSGALARAVTGALAADKPAEAAAFLAEVPKYGLALGPNWLAKAAHKLAASEPAAAVAAAQPIAARGAGGPAAAASALAVAAAAGRADLATAWAGAYEKAGVRLNGAARGALARATDAKEEEDGDGGKGEGGGGEGEGGEGGGDKV